MEERRQGESEREGEKRQGERRKREDKERGFSVSDRADLSFFATTVSPKKKRLASSQHQVGREREETREGEENPSSVF